MCVCACLCVEGKDLECTIALRNTGKEGIRRRVTERYREDKRLFLGHWRKFLNHGGIITVCPLAILMKIKFQNSNDIKS